MQDRRRLSRMAAWRRVVCRPGRREKQQRPALESDRCHEAQVPREVRSQRAAPCEARAGGGYFDIFFFFAFFVAMAYFLLA